MAGPGFGFSVGDFITGLQLAKELVQALNDGVGAKPAYRRLTAELGNLVCALQEVRHIQVDNSHASQKTALEQAASQCQRSIEHFLNKNAKFQSSLGEERTTSRFRANLHKIQWALCKKDEIDQLRTEILGHTSVINTLLITLQSSAAALQTELMQDHRRDTQEQSFILSETQEQVTQTHDMLRAQADTISKISEILGTSTSQPKSQDLESIMARALDTNMKICRWALDMQKAQARPHIPPQVEHQQPVRFEDAHGRVAPFHVEFINSFEAFQAVMEIRFRHVPGLRKVQNMEYAIREPGSNRLLNLQAPWESVFLPGRKVTMSMIFWRPPTSMSCCPGCRSENHKTGTESEVQCPNPNCGIWYERIIDFDMSRGMPECPCPSALEVQKCLKSSCPRIRPKTTYNIENENEIHQFRRVQVRHILSLSKGFPAAITAGSAHHRPSALVPVLEELLVK